MLCASLLLTCGLHRQQLARQSVHLQTAEGVARGQQGLALPTGHAPVQQVQGSCTTISRRMKSCQLGCCWASTT